MIKITRGSQGGMARMLKRLDSLTSSSKVDVTNVISATVKRLVVKSAGEGTSPDGIPWAATKDGRKALKNAAKQVTVTVSGASAIVRAPSPLGYHQTGTSRGLVARPIIPASLPPKWRKSILRAVAVWYRALWRSLQPVRITADWGDAG